MVQNFATVIAHENKYVEGTQTSIRIFVHNNGFSRQLTFENRVTRRSDGCRDERVKIISLPRQILIIGYSYQRMAMSNVYSKPAIVM